MRIVVFCPNLIGDTVMATPVLRSLRQSEPGATIDAVVRSHVAPTLEGNPWLGNVLRYDPRSPDPARRSWGIIRELRRRSYDLAILLPNSFRSAWMAWLGGCRHRVGYARGGRGWLLTERLAPPRDERGELAVTPAVEYYTDILRRLDYRVDSPHLELFTTPDDERAADRAWQELGLSAARSVVGFNTGGAFGPAKSWPTEHFAELARRLSDEIGVAVLVLCGPGERAAARAIVQGANRPRVVSLADQTLSIGLSKACVRRCDLLVTTDSGPRHFAAAFGVPVVTLFGPTHIGWTRTYHPHALHLQHPVPCGPCQRGVCPLKHHRCMRELLPETVFEAVLRLLPLSRSPKTAPATNTR